MSSPCIRRVILYTAAALCLIRQAKGETSNGFHAHEVCSAAFANMSQDRAAGCITRTTQFGSNTLIEVYTQDHKYCKEGNILPLLKEEGVWNAYFRSAVYFVLLVYLFIGIAMVSDIFMSAIEVITSKSKTLSYLDEDGKRKESTILIWNETVANLTLMALGSSAPEILLAVSETITTLGDPPSRDGLGAATIIGSAAYNLLVISALCILSTPDGQARRIKGLDVFAVTSFFSIFAYVWVYIVLVANTEDVVDLWEALVTLAMFPLLVAMSYGMDAKPCGSVSSVRPTSMRKGLTFRETTAKVHKHFVHAFVKGKKHQDPANLAAALTQMVYDERKKSTLHYRINAIRVLKGGKRIIPKIQQSSFFNPGHAKETKQQQQLQEQQQQEQQQQEQQQQQQQPQQQPQPQQPTDPAQPVAYTSISSREYEVCDEDKFVPITIERTGHLDSEAVVEYETGNGTAKAQQHYAHTSGVAQFSRGQDVFKFNVPIFGGVAKHVESLHFSIRLQDYGKDTVAGPISTARVSIVSHDSPGTFEFAQTSVKTTEDVGVLKVAVHRTGGVAGKAKLRWTAKSDHLDIKSREKAMAGSDFYPDEGEIEFAQGEKVKTIEIHIVDDDQCESDEKFEVQLHTAKDCDAVNIGHRNKCLVTILDNDEISNMVEKVCAMLDVNMDKLHVSSTSWASQFADAMQVMGDDDEKPGAVDYVMHAITFFWKVLFAFVPPTNIWGGWFAFVTSLVFIGLLTVIVSDAATIFGCSIGMPDVVTAITFVALGTSLPDTFASMTAARQDAYADASIGNITGSNSVNVFLGLGLPWTIAALYHAQRGEVYVFYGGTLGYSVVVFCVCAMLCIALLMVRRHPKMAAGELGGPRKLKLYSAAILLVLWALYIALSSIRSLQE